MNAVRALADEMPAAGPIPEPANVVLIAGKPVMRFLWMLGVLGILLLGVGVWIGVELAQIRTIESNRSGYQQATLDVLCEIRKLLGGK